VYIVLQSKNRRLFFKNIHCLAIQFTLFIFVTDFNNRLLSIITGGEICNQMTFLSYNIQFMYKYYRIEKQERFRMLSVQKINNNATIKYKKKPNIR